LYSSEHVICGAIDSIPFCMPVGMLYKFVESMANPMLGSKPNSSRLMTGTMKNTVNGIQYCPIITIWDSGGSYKLIHIEKSLGNNQAMDFDYCNSPTPKWCAKPKSASARLYGMLPDTGTSNVSIDVIYNERNRRFAVSDLATVARKVADVYDIPKSKLTDEIYRIPWTVTEHTYFEFIGGHLTGKVRSSPKQNLVSKEGYKELETRNVIYKHQRFFMEEMRNKKFNITTGKVQTGNAIDVFETIELTETEIELLSSLATSGKNSAVFDVFRSIVTADIRYGKLLYEAWKNYPVDTLPPTILSFRIDDACSIFTGNTSTNIVINQQLLSFLSFKQVVPTFDKDGRLLKDTCYQQTTLQLNSCSPNVYTIKMGDQQWQ